MYVWLRPCSGGSRLARSDSTGFYSVWDLVPFEPVMVSLDSLSLESPLLVPLFARTSIVPGSPSGRVGQDRRISSCG